jgi:CHAD domain-containing protein
VKVEPRTERSPVQDVIQIAREQLSKAIRLLVEEPALDRGVIVHEVRKRIKKVRALLGLARGSANSKAIRKADRRLRDAGRQLSEVRDSSVLISTLDALAARSVGLVPPELSARARAPLVARLDEIVREVLDDDKALARTSKALRSVRGRLGDWESIDVRSDAPPALKKTYKEARGLFKVVADEPTSERLHELRKRVKTLGYQLRVLDAESTSPAARLQRLAGLLADELGEIHDLDVLRPFLESGEGSGPLLGALDRRRLDLRQAAIQRAGVVFRDRPRAFLGSVEDSSKPVETA